RGTLLGALLGLLARLALLRVVLRRALLDTRGIEEAGDAVGRLRADTEPVTRAILVELHAVLVVLCEQRVVGANLLEIAAVTRRTAVCHDDAVIRTLLGAAPRKPDLYCHDGLPFQFNPLNSFLLEKVLQVGRQLGAAGRRAAEPWQAARGAAEAAHPAAAAEQRAEALEAAHLPELLHRAAHFLVHLEELVDVLHLGARARGNALLALGVHQFGAGALHRRHRADDRVHVNQYLVVDPARGHRLLGLLHAREHVGEHAEPAHLLHLAQLGPEVVEVELALEHALGLTLGILLLDDLGSLFDDRDDIAHAED